MTDNLQRIRDMEEKRIEALYHDLNRDFHLLRWHGMMFKPRWWRFGQRKLYHQMQVIFLRHGFCLTDRVATRMYMAECQRFDEDAGGAQCRQLLFALDGQVLI